MKRPLRPLLAFAASTILSLQGASEAPLLEIGIKDSNGSPAAELHFQAEADCFYVIERSIDGGEWLILQIAMGEGEPLHLLDPLLPNTVLYRVSEGLEQPPVVTPPGLTTVDDLSPAPEPSMVLLLILSAFGFAKRRR
ncbi:MAG: PEP-CTERM sorting domain-containing protein [Roseibacillus sp.]